MCVRVPGRRARRHVRPARGSGAAPTARHVFPGRRPRAHHGRCRAGRGVVRRWSARAANAMLVIMRTKNTRPPTSLTAAQPPGGLPLKAKPPASSSTLTSAGNTPWVVSTSTPTRPLVSAAPSRRLPPAPSRTHTTPHAAPLLQRGEPAPPAGLPSRWHRCASPPAPHAPHALPAQARAPWRANGGCGADMRVPVPLRLRLHTHTHPTAPRSTAATRAARVARRPHPRFQVPEDHPPLQQQRRQQGSVGRGQDVHVAHAPRLLGHEVYLRRAGSRGSQVLAGVVRRQPWQQVSVRRACVLRGFAALWQRCGALAGPSTATRRRPVHPRVGTSSLRQNGCPHPLHPRPPPAAAAWCWRARGGRHSGCKGRVGSRTALPTAGTNPPTTLQ